MSSTEQIALEIKEQFPIFTNHPELVFLDSAASSQKPISVIDSMNSYYQKSHANVHRGLYKLSNAATDLFEDSRTTLQKFINANSRSEIIFTKGCTEAINLVASSLAKDPNITEESNIIVTVLEHHANFVPWFNLAKSKNCQLKIAKLDPKGNISLAEIEKLVDANTKLVAMSHISNISGQITDVAKICSSLSKKKILTLVDGAQAGAHAIIDVQKINCDFYALSSHKMFGPTGIGLLYGKKHLLEAMEPYQFGGDMILEVTPENIIYNQPPYKFESGTPPIAEAIGFSEAVKFINSFDRSDIAKHDQELKDYMLARFEKLAQFKQFPRGDHSTAICSFAHDKLHTHDLATLLDQDHIAVRTGHHCAMIAHQEYNIKASSRLSCSWYNTIQDLKLAFTAIEKALKLFKLL
jgi:cysteine desulfurase/selenocysteine lyase